MRLLRNRPRFMCSLILASAIGIAGCTRKTGDNVTIHLSFAGSGGQSKVNGAAAADTNIQVIIINVTGPGMTPVFYQWNGNSHNGTMLTPPTDIPLTVSQGDSRLIQVLLVDKTTSTGSNSFYYDDVTQSLSGTDASATFTLDATKRIGAAASGDAELGGRYLRADGVTGPTGKVRVFYPIPNKPAMMVDENNEIFAGWFNVFSIEGAQLIYKLEDGSDLFAGLGGTAGVGVGSPGMVGTGTTSPQRARIHIPQYFYLPNGGGNTRVSNSASHDVYGFFGPGATGKQLCYSTTPSSTSYSYVAAVGNTTVQWVGVGGTIADAYVEAGGIGSTSCTGLGTQFVDYIKINDAQITSHDSTLGFKGPFQQQGSNNDIFTATIAGGSLSLGWIYMPGVQTSSITGKGIDGADVFLRVETQASMSVQDYRGNNDGVACANLSSLGFSGPYNQPSNPDVVAVTAVNPVPPLLAVNMTISGYPTGFDTALGQGLATIISCPYTMDAAGKRYFSSAATRQAYGSMSGSGGPPATSFTVVTPQVPGQAVSNPVQIANTVCTHFQVQGLNGASPAMFPASTNFSFTTDNVALKVFQDDSCTNPITTSVSYGGGMFDFFVQDIDGAPMSHNFTVTATGGLSSTQTVNTISQAANGNPAHPMLLVNAPTSIVTYNCYPVSYESWNFDNITSANTVPQNLNSFSPMEPAGIQFFTDGQCSTTGGSMIYLFSPQSFTHMSFKYSTPTPASTISLQPTSGLGTATVQGGAGITVTSPGAITKLSMNLNMSASAGSCLPVQLNFADANGNASPATANAVVTLSSTGGTFYQYGGSTCNTPIGSAQIYANQPGPTQTIFFQPTSVGPVTLTATSDTPVMTATANLTVGPAVASQIVVLFPGQTLTGTPPFMSPPSAPAQGLGSTFPVGLWAVKYDGSVDTSYNSTLISLTNSGGFQTIPSPATVTFVSGHASFVATALPSGFSFAYLNGSAQGQMGSMSFSVGLPLVPMATQFSIYANNMATLTPNTCQIFMVVPEDINGLAATPAVPVTVNLSAGGFGSIYTDAACTSAVSAYGFSQTDHYHVFYLKGNSSSSGSIIATASGYTPGSLPFTVGATGAPSVPSSWQIIGRRLSAHHTLAGQCNPYVVYLSDSSGNSVVPAGPINNLRVQMTLVSGTTGYFNLNLPCNSGSFIDGASQTMFANPGFSAFFGAAPPNPTSTEGVLVNDATSTYLPSSTMQIGD